MYKSRKIWEAYNGVVYDTQLLNFTTAFIAKRCGPGNILRIGSSLFTWFREGAHFLTKHLLFQSLFSGCKVNETATQKSEQFLLLKIINLFQMFQSLERTLHYHHSKAISKSVK